MQKSNIFTWILLLLLLLILLGYVSLGDVLGVIFSILGGLVLLGLVGLLVIRYRIRRLQRRMEQEAGQGGAAYRTYTWGFGQERRKENRRDGDVTVERTATPRKKVSREVGEYVDYEDVEEQR